YPAARFRPRKRAAPILVSNLCHNGACTTKRVFRSRFRQPGADRIVENVLDRPLQILVAPKEVIVEPLLPDEPATATVPGQTRAEAFEAADELDDRRRVRR